MREGVGAVAKDVDQGLLWIWSRSWARAFAVRPRLVPASAEHACAQHSGIWPERAARPVEARLLMCGL